MKQKNSGDRVRTLSPIQRTTAANTNHHKTEVNELKDRIKSGKNGNLETKNKALTPKKPQLIIAGRPKNINEYRHLVENNIGFTDPDLEWTVDLREYGKRSQRYVVNKNSGISKPPSFYDEDLKKYKAKNKEKSVNSLGNWSNYQHLTRNCLGESVNQSQFQYGTTLRNIRQVNKKNINPNKWKELPYKLRNDEVTFLPPFTEKEKQSINKIDKYLLRPYETTYEQVLVGKDYIKRKKLRANKAITLGHYGSHMSLRPYTSNYQDKNILIGKNVYSKHTNSLCLFEMGMRMYGNVEKKPIEKYVPKKKKSAEPKENIKNLKSKMNLE